MLGISATVEKLFALYRKKYFDSNAQHFHPAVAGHGIKLSYARSNASYLSITDRQDKLPAYDNHSNRKNSSQVYLHSS